MARLPHARKLTGRSYVRIEHGLTKRDAQKRAARERRKGRKARVILEGGMFSVFVRVR